MATIGNIPEYYTNGTPTERIGGYTPYTPYWETVAERIQRQRDNYPTTAWEYHTSNVDVEDLKRRVRWLENELATTKERCAYLEDTVIRLDGMIQEMKDSIWFSFIDIK